MSLSVINPKTGREITIGQSTYKTLVKQGYTYDANTNQLTLATSSTAPTLPVIIKPISPPSPPPSKPIISAPKLKPPPISNAGITTLAKLKEVDLTNDDLTIKSLGLDDYQIDRIVHISDTHIPIHLHLNRKDEYLIVFNRVYKYLQELKTQHRIAIVITGDLLHVKLNLEAETVILARDFLTNLVKIAPTILIIGNHDFAENNKTRADSMTAVCHGIDIRCLKYTGIYQLGNVLFAFSSLFDNKFIHYQDIIDTKGLPVYKLYHGTVLGSVNCNGTSNNKSTHRQYPCVGDLIGYNAVLMGHIHKYQKLTPHIAYAGSLIQQNYGEAIDDHGLLVWDTNTHISEFVSIPNDYIFLDVIIDQGKITNQTALDSYSDKHMRVRCKNTDTTLTQYTQIQNELKNIYKISEIQTGKPISNTATIASNASIPANHTTLEQEIDLINKLGKTELHACIIELHQTLRTNSVTQPCATWNIVSIRFKNVFIYGNDHINYINFDEGVYNLCAPNTAGKSSIAHVILYALFDKTSNNSSSKSDIVHMGKNSGFIELVFIHNGSQYQITKTANKKTRKGETSYVFDVNFVKLSDNPNDIVELNGKDSRDTVEKIKEYVGEFGLFTTHHIISTKLGSSLVQMTPADKLKHFHRLCNTDQYEEFVKSCKATKTKDTTTLNLLQGRLQSLLDGIKTTDITNDKHLISQSETEYQVVKKQLDDSIHQKMDRSVEKGTLDAKLISLRNQRTSPIEPPTQTKENLRQTIGQTLGQISQLDTNGLISGSIKGHTTQSLNSLIAVYQEEIQPCEFSSTDINEQIEQVQSKITQHQLRQPTSSENTLRQQKTTLENHIRDLCRTRKQHETHKQALLVDISQKVTLSKQKAQLDKRVIELKHQLGTMPTLSLSHYQTQLSTLGLDKVTDTRDQIKKQIAVTQYQLTLIQQQLQKLTPKTKQKTTHTAEQLTSSLKPERPVAHKQDVNPQDIAKITQEITRLTELCSYTDYTQVDTLLDSLSFDHEGLANIHQTHVQQLRTFVDAVRNGNFAKILKLNNQLHQIQLKEAHNQQVDSDLDYNRQVRTHNQQVEYQLTWLIHQQITHDHQQLDIQKHDLDTQLTYYQLQDQIELLKIRDQITNIDRQLTLIANYESRMEYELLELNQSQDQTSLALVNDQLTWYTQQQGHHEQLSHWQETQEIINTNQKYLTLIETTKHQLQIAKLLDKIQESEKFIKDWENLENQKKITEQITIIEKQLPNLVTNIQTYEQTINKLQVSVDQLSQQITTSRLHLEQHQHTSETIDKLKTDITKLDEKIKIYTEYERLFHRSVIPFELMKLKLTSLNDLINNIFEKYTKYTFKYDQSESGKLVFLAVDRSQGTTLEPERLSGFESVILQLAINYAILNISDTFKCGFIIVDESLDCIDQNRFIADLPYIIDAVKHYYQLVLLISHRDVPDQIIDKQLKICNYQTYSTINHQ